MNFAQIPGKDSVKSNLTQAIDKARVPHAQIFLGKEGAGGLAMALATASYIVCEDKQNGDSCGVCNQCSKSSKFIHPDIHFSFPVVKMGDLKRADITSDNYLPQWRKILTSNPYMGTNQWLSHIKAGNTAPNINVKECNDIIRKLNMMSYESEYKILIMWLPEYLGTEGNRLLKLIEEPTDKTFIILVAEDQERIIQTILSRCQLVKIPSFESKEIAAYLSQHLHIDTAKAEQIANLSEGNINQAISIGKNEAPDYSDKLIQWLRLAYRSEPVEINDWITALTDMSKDEQMNFLKYGLHFFRQFVFWYLTKSTDVNLTAKELDIAEKMSSLINVEKAGAITDLINMATENLPRNASIKIMLFADTLAIGSIMRAK
jgi:DNA polymerase III subunit delta'